MNSKCPSTNGYFARYLRYAQILFLEILNVFLRIKFSHAWISNKLSHSWTDTIKLLIRIRGWLPTAVLLTTALVIFLPATAAAAQEVAGWRPTYDLIMRWVNFLILVFVIVKFARAPLKGFFKQKKEEVASEIAAMEAEKKAAETKIAEARQAIEQRQERFKKMQERIIKQGKRRKEEIIEGARKESRLMIEAARHRVEGQIRLAREKLKEEMVDIAIDTAMKRLPAEMVEADTQNLLNQYLEAVEQN